MDRVKSLTTVTHIAVGTCRCRGTRKKWLWVIVTGAATVMAEGLPVARQTDIVVGCCVGVIVVKSITTTAMGLPTARIGDSVRGSPIATIVTGVGSTKNDDIVG